MTAAETLREFARLVEANKVIVRKEAETLEGATKLMRETKAQHITDAINEKARLMTIKGLRK